MNTEIKSKSVLNEENIKKAVNRNMVLLLLGKFISLFGSAVYNFAVGLYVLQVTGSGLNFAITIALGSLPRVLFGPIAGVMADRVDRKKMVVTLDILSGLVVLGLLVLSIFNGLKLSYIYMTTFLLTTCNTFFSVPLSSSIPNLVDDGNLTRINSLSQSVQSISSIIAPAIGGMIFFLVDIRLFLLVNGISFIISGISEVFIDFNLREKLNKKEQEVTPKINKEKPAILTELVEGLKYIVSCKWILIFGSFTILLNMITMIGLTIPIPYIVNNIWGFTSKQYGLLSMTFPAGMLIGSLILSALPESKSIFRRIIISLSVSSIVILIVGIVTSELLLVLTNGYYLVILMILFAIMAISLIFINVPLNVTLQRLVPNDKRGRVFGTLGTASAALTPLGAIIGGILVDTIDPWMLPVGCGIVMLIITAFMYSNEELKNI